MSVVPLPCYATAVYPYRMSSMGPLGLAYTQHEEKPLSATNGPHSIIFPFIRIYGGLAWWGRLRPPQTPIITDNKCNLYWHVTGWV